MTGAFGRSGASVTGRIGSALVALGVTGVLAAPGVAIAAPAPCEQADRYAAEAGAQVMRVNRLDRGSAGTASDVTLAEAKSAMVAQSTVNAAAVTRILDANRGDTLTDPLIQQAPPSNRTPARRTATQRNAGPFTLRGGTLTSHARWDPRMACGRAAGPVTRAEAAVAQPAIAELIRLPGGARGSGTTTLEGGGRTVASSTLAINGLEVAGGVVRVRVVRAPALVAGMSTTTGGAVDYQPPVLEVSGDGIEPSRLDTAGDHVDIALGDDDEPDAHRTGAPEVAEDQARPTSSDGSAVDLAGPAGTHSPRPSLLDGLTGNLPRLGALAGGAPLPLPTVPGVPKIGDEPESAPVAMPGTRVHISLGDVRQATSGHAIAARATAIKIVMTQGSRTARASQGYGGRDSVVLDLDLGVLEAAAVAPEPSARFEGAVAGAGGGLPITGPRVDLIALTGIAFLAAGLAALLLGLRGHRA